VGLKQEAKSVKRILSVKSMVCRETDKFFFVGDEAVISQRGIA
jgi:hypothetical protein